MEEMERYIGVKAIKAKPMNLQEYHDYRGWDLPKNENGLDEGYLVEYADNRIFNHPNHAGYISWSPKEVFEQAYRKTDCEDSITEKEVSSWIDNITVYTLENKKTTMVSATLINGFTIVESSSCVDPKNYSEAMGANICMGKIKDKVWELLGFLLQCTKMSGK